MKRFQECNIIIKLYRLRYYILVPILYLYHTLIKPMTYNDYVIANGVYTNTFNTKKFRGKGLWGMLVSMAQIKMDWTYSGDELKEYLNL